MTDKLEGDALSATARTGQPQAQYRLGALHFSRGEIRPAMDWLERAAEQGVEEAQNLLGVIYLNGIGIPCQPQKAVELFSAAAQRDLKEAHFNLAGLLFSGVVVQDSDAVAIKHLLRAAELRHRPALRVLGYLYSIAGDTALQELATLCFTHAALQGDAHGEYMLGTRYTQGVGVDANHDEGVYWLYRAANRQLYCAGQHLAALRMEMGEARLQRIARLHVPEANSLAARAIEWRDPGIIAAPPPQSRQYPGSVCEYPGILEEPLCDYLVNLAAPHVQLSGVIDPATGQPLKTALRTSSSMNFQLSMYDMAVSVICRRMAGLSGMTANHAEPISVLRYLPGEEYRPHYDHFAVDEHGAPMVRDDNGQRTMTVFVYLNAVDAGGETDFPRLALRVQPQKGKAVAFLNCDTAGNPNPDTLHAGLPVMRGEKWLATLWFRERSFHWV
ncbi:MAG: 2OG-Fe(II) oxygenase [Gammaproteobacteria bacterium]